MCPPVCGPLLISSGRRKNNLSSRRTLHVAQSVLTKYLTAMGQQGVSHFTHHAAFWRKAMPEQHAALEQPRRQIDQLATFQLFLNLQVWDHAAGGALARQLHKGF